MDTLQSGAVAAMPPKAPLWHRIFALAAFILLPIAVLTVANLAASWLVRVWADLRLGIDPFLATALRPRLSAYELGLRNIGASLLGQVLTALLVIGLAIWADGAAWRRRLGLTRPAEPRRPAPRTLVLALLILIWPIVHIAWVAGTAKALNLGFGQGLKVSPFLTSTLVVLSSASVMLIAPAVEELLVRGEAYARACRIMGPAGAIVSTALLFCSLHLTGSNLARPLSLLPLAVTLGWLRWRTGRLWPCILLHAWSNSALILYLFWAGSR